jgi:hypothetical protein
MKKVVLALLTCGAVAVAVAGAAIARSSAVKPAACPSPDTRHADGEWRVAIGSFPTRAQAQGLVNRAAGLGFRNLGIEIQLGPRYIVALDGLHTRTQVSEDVKEAKSAGLTVLGLETELSPCR